MRISLQHCRLAKLQPVRIRAQWKSHRNPSFLFFVQNGTISHSRVLCGRLFVYLPQRNLLTNTRLNFLELVYSWSQEQRKSVAFACRKQDAFCFAGDVEWLEQALGKRSVARSIRRPRLIFPPPSLRPSFVRYGAATDSKWPIQRPKLGL